jgi:DNA-binding winged helix-turn-helix (wHTH) protein
MLVDANREHGSLANNIYIVLLEAIYNQTFDSTTRMSKAVQIDYMKVKLLQLFLELL